MSLTTNNHLKLNEFKEAYRKISVSVPRPLRTLVLGFLVWLEEHYITAKAKAAVDKALDEYKQIEAPMPKVVGVYSETGSGFFDEMRITATFEGRPIYDPTDQQ